MTSDGRLRNRVIVISHEVLFPRVIEWAQFTALANAAGTPSVSLPMGRDDATGMPIGMMFSGHFAQERLLLELALQLEEAAPWPDVASSPLRA